MQQWQDLYSDSCKKTICLDTWRIVEYQAKSYTRKYVDSHEEHEVLENIIESSKPQQKIAINETAEEFNLHYLLTTEFRYPSLKWGSRFGTRFERSILYTSVDLETAMSEKAFYKLSFLRASSGDVGGKNIPLTAFKINVASQAHLALSERPFAKYTNEISSKVSYIQSQKLGMVMRENRVECFDFTSARASNNGINYGIFTPKALENNHDLEQTQLNLSCYANKEVVEITGSMKNIPECTFPVSRYYVDGRFPISPEFISVS